MQRNSAGPLPTLERSHDGPAKSGSATLAHDRRAALRSVGLGLAALGALPLLAQNADAKKRGKKPGKVKDRCLPQVAECEAGAAALA